MNQKVESMRLLSPRRNSTSGESAESLASEQLEHFGIDPKSEYGKSLSEVVRRMYEAQSDIGSLWASSMSDLAELPQLSLIHI